MNKLYHILYILLMVSFAEKAICQSIGASVITNAVMESSNEDCGIISVVGEPISGFVSNEEFGVSQGFLSTTIFDGGSVENECLTQSGSIFFEDCDDGELFFFIESDGIIYDPYYDTGVSFQHEDGQKVKFGFREAEFETPCSNADKAIWITCIEELSIFESALAPGTYDFTVCQAETLTLDVRVPPGIGQTESPCNGQGVVSGDLQNISGVVPNEDGTLTVTIFHDASFSYSIQLSGPDGIPCDFVWNFNFTIDPECNPEDLAESYPWIFDFGLVDETDCEGVTITEYTQYGENYIFIQTPESEIIYSPAGVQNCITQSGGATVCASLEDFGLTEVIGVWECPITPVPDCARFSGTIFFENCDDGELFFFIRTEADEILDPYYAEGVDFQHEDNLKVIFDYVEVDFETPCSIAEKAVSITCIQEEIASSTREFDFVEFKVYPNPTKDILYLEISESTHIENVTIFDQLGKVILKQSIQTEISSIDTKDFQPGIYYVTIHGENESKIEKITILR